MSTKRIDSIQAQRDVIANINGRFWSSNVECSNNKKAQKTCLNFRRLT
jgi:hypothetical protein